MTWNSPLAQHLPLFQRRFFQHLQEPSLQAVSSLFVDQKPHLLPRNTIFYSHSLSLCYNTPLIGEVYFFNNSFVNFSFFQNYSSR